MLESSHHRRADEWRVNEAVAPSRLTLLVVIESGATSPRSWPSRRWVETSSPPTLQHPLGRASLSGSGVADGMSLHILTVWLVASQLFSSKANMDSFRKIS